MNVSKSIFAILLIVFSIPGFAQEKKPDANSEQEHLNEVIALTRKLKTQIEESARFAKSSIDKSSPEYEKMFRDYLQIQSEFDEWIEFYILEFESSLKNKKYKINTQRLDSLVTSSINDANRFIGNLNNNTNLASRGVTLDLITGATDYIKKAYDLYKAFRDAKKEKRDMIIKDLREKFSKYKLTSFVDLKTD